MDEIPDELKKAIAEDYKEIRERKQISDVAEKHGVSEATVHKYKNFERPSEEQPHDFEGDFKPDDKPKGKGDEDENEDEDDDDDDDENIEVELVF